MRRLLTFACDGETLAATLDEADGATGLLLVTGGSQTRIGSHRMYERLAKTLAERGFPCFRFDRRGVGDSSGGDPGFRDSAPDLEAAAAAFRAAAPKLRRIVGFGLCDGATAIALFGERAGLSGLVLVNPWLVEAESGEPAPAAIREHYRRRLLSREGWRKMLSGAVDYRKLLQGIMKIARPRRPAPLAQQTAAALARHRLPASLILAERDSTAIAARAELKKGRLGANFAHLATVDTDSHTFARPGDEAALAAAVLDALARLEAHAS